MQAMGEEQEQPMPTQLLITPETRRLDVELRPPSAGAGGRSGEVAVDLRLAITECHTWLGIGGRTARVRRPKRLSRKIPLTLDGNSSSSGGGGDGVDCRRRLGRAIKNSLRKEEEYRFLSPARWDEAVPLGVERALILAAQHAGAGSGGGGTCEARLDISVRFEFVYSEPDALLRACVENGGGGGEPAWRRSGNGDGDAPACTICLKGMSRDADDEVVDMPGCTHGFHPWCIAAWFHKASTCPVCRRDQLQYLPPDYRDLHDRMIMTVDPDSLPDYL